MDKVASSCSLEWVPSIDVAGLDESSGCRSVMRVPFVDLAGVGTAGFNSFLGESACC